MELKTDISGVVQPYVRIMRLQETEYIQKREGPSWGIMTQGVEYCVLLEYLLAVNIDVHAKHILVDLDFGSYAVYINSENEDQKATYHVVMEDPLELGDYISYPRILEWLAQAVKAYYQTPQFSYPFGEPPNDVPR